MVLADPLSPPLQLHQLLVAWQLGPLDATALGLEVAVAAGYVLAARRLRRRRRWPPWRTASFLAGMATVVLAVQSPLASYDDSVFVVHALQHVLLMTVAPILFALAAPVTLALQASNRRLQRAILRVLHSAPGRLVTHPAWVLVIGYGTMLGYFLTGYYELSVAHPLVHDLAHLHFLIAGILYWWLVVGLDPGPRRLSHPAKLGILATGIPVGTILGMTLTTMRSSIDPAAHTVADTHAGGALLWVTSELTTLVALGIVLAQWMGAEERRAARLDRQLDAEAAAAAAVGAPVGFAPDAPPRATAPVPATGTAGSGGQPAKSSLTSTKGAAHGGPSATARVGRRRGSAGTTTTEDHRVP